MAGDFNGDGRTDLAIAGLAIAGDSSGQNRVEVLLGDGDGAFRAATVDLGTITPQSLVAGDFNGDGRTDLVVAGGSSVQGQVEVLPGDGDGTFRTAPPINLGDFGGGDLVAGDFNGDGRTDLAIAGGSSGQGRVEVLLGDGDGTFRAAPPINLGDFGLLVQSALVAGGFNGDGRTDLAATNGSGVQVALSLGDGYFASPGELALAIHDTPLVAGLNGDGINDVFIINQAGDILWRKGRPTHAAPSIRPSRSISTLLHATNPRARIAFVSTRQGPLIASVNARDDAVSLFAYRGGHIVWVGLLPTGALPRRSPRPTSTMQELRPGRPQRRRRHRVGLPRRRQGRVRQAGRYPHRPRRLGHRPGRPRRDGRVDLVVTNQVTGDVRVLLDHGDGTFGGTLRYHAGSGHTGRTLPLTGRPTSCLRRRRRAWRSAS